MLMTTTQIVLLLALLLSMFFAADYMPAHLYSVNHQWKVYVDQRGWGGNDFDVVLVYRYPQWFPFVEKKAFELSVAPNSCNHPVLKPSAGKTSRDISVVCGENQIGTFPIH